MELQSATYPVSTASVPRLGRTAGASKVEQDWSVVVNGSVKSKSNLAAGIDRQSLCRATSTGTNIASHIIAGGVYNWRVVVGVCTEVLVCRTAIDGLEDIFEKDKLALILDFINDSCQVYPYNGQTQSARGKRHWRGFRKPSL